MISMLWKECMAPIFYKYICQEENFIYLNWKNVYQPKVSEIITNFSKENEKNHMLLRNNLSQFKKIVQYVYSNVSLEVYCSTKRRGFDLKSTFHILFNVNKNKKNEHLWKNSKSYKKKPCWNICFWIKLIKIDDFNEPKIRRWKKALK